MRLTPEEMVSTNSRLSQSAWMASCGTDMVRSRGGEELVRGGGGAALLIGTRRTMARVRCGAERSGCCRGWGSRPGPEAAQTGEREDGGGAPFWGPAVCWLAPCCVRASLYY